MRQTATKVFLFSLLMTTFFAHASEPVPKEHGQALTYKGVVVDESGEPLIGVRVLVETTGKEVFTDMKGRFSIKSSPSAIRFDYPGKTACVLELKADQEESPELNEVVLADSL